MTTLVLLPGMDGTGDLFAPLLRQLDPRLSVNIARYPRNMALSYAQLETYAKAVCPMNQPYVLLGESFSGPLAIKLAASNPAGLQGMILCASFAANPMPALAPFARLTKLLPLHRTPPALLRAMLLGQFATDELQHALVHAVHGVHNEVLQYRLQQITKVDVRDELTKVQVPILYLQAAHDRLVPASAAQLIKQHNSTVQIAKLQGPPCLLQANPIDAAAQLPRFFTNICQESPTPTSVND